MPQVGQTYTLSGSINTGSAPGQNQYSVGSGQQVKIIGQRNVGGQDYYDIQHIGGGTGWVSASQLSGSITNASQIQAPVNPSYTTGSLESEVNQARNVLSQTLAQQRGQTQAQLNEAREREKVALNEIDKLTTPFREELEKSERERLGTDTVLSQQKQLLGELEQLLTEGNELIKQQKSVTGLAAIRNPRIQKTMEDVIARAGVIEAVVNLQNTYLSNAYTSIDRSVNAINQDRRDRIGYYSTILDLANRDIVSLSAEDRKLADKEISLLERDLVRAEEVADYVKKLMIDPGTAMLMAEGGVTLNDSIEVINKKLTQAQYDREVREQANEIMLQGGIPIVDPRTVPANQLASFTDARGQVHYYKLPKSSSGTGTASERAVASVSESISAQSMSFPDAVVRYANQLSLSEIYAAYNQSQMGKTYGLPKESPNEIALLYKWAVGEITESQYREALEG